MKTVKSIAASLIVSSFAVSAFAQTTPTPPPPPPPGPVDTCKPTSSTITKSFPNAGVIETKTTTTAIPALKAGPTACIDAPPCTTVTQPKTTYTAWEKEHTFKTTISKYQSSDFTQSLVDMFLSIIGVPLKKKDFEQASEETDRVKVSGPAGEIACDMAIHCYIYEVDKTVNETSILNGVNSRKIVTRYAHAGSVVTFNTKEWSWDGCTWTRIAQPPPPGCPGGGTGGTTGATELCDTPAEPCGL